MLPTRRRGDWGPPQREARRSDRDMKTEADGPTSVSLKPCLAVPRSHIISAFLTGSRQVGSPTARPVVIPAVRWGVWAGGSIPLSRRHLLPGAHRQVVHRAQARSPSVDVRPRTPLVSLRRQLASIEAKPPNGTVHWAAANDVDFRIHAARDSGATVCSVTIYGDR